MGDAPFYSTRFYDDGSPVSSDQSVDDHHEQGNYIPYPCLGIILEVHPIDSVNNASRIFKDFITHTWSSTESAGYISSAAESSSGVGPHVECSVRILSGLPTDELPLNNVPVCISFGGVDNYGFVTPQGTTNTSRVSDLYKSNGDFCIIQFLGGDRTRPIITNIFPHPYNRDGPRVDDGRTAFFKFNGFEFYLDSVGSLHVDGTKSGSTITINPEDGSTNLVQPNREVADPEEDHPPGVIIIENNSNIIIEAGVDTVQGNLALIGKTTVRLRSETERVTLDTGDTDKPVDVQTEHGGLRPAARKGDRVRITSGNEGDLFPWIKTLKGVLGEVGDLLVSGNTVAAGGMLSAFANGIALPTNHEGRIIEGSEYCNIGGESTSQDIGGDESGFADPDAVKADKATCDISAVANYIKKYTVFLQEKAAAKVSAALDSAAQIIEVNPFLGGPVAADTLRQTIPIVAQLLLSGGSGGDIEANSTKLTELSAERDKAITDGDATAQKTAEDGMSSTITDIQAEADAVDVPKASDSVSGAVNISSLDDVTGGAASQLSDTCLDEAL
jgi:hypothetical protein